MGFAALPFSLPAPLCWVAGGLYCVLVLLFVVRHGVMTWILVRRWWQVKDEVPLDELRPWTEAIRRLLERLGRH